MDGSYCYYCSSFKHSLYGINFPVIIYYKTKVKTFQQLFPTTTKTNCRKLIAKIILKIMTGKCNQNHSVLSLDLVENMFAVS